MTFEPTLVGKVWLCPCQDAYGETASLQAMPHQTVDHLPDGGHVHNYECDQNRDRWQFVERVDGTKSWQYLGRRPEA